MRVRSLLLSCAALALLAGCGRRETRSEAADADQTLLLGNGAEPEDLDPQIVTIYTDQNILLALFEGLTAIDETTSAAVPGAAQSWEASPDRLAWTFHLRPGLRWSNGEPLVASDFVASWRRILSPGLGSEYAYLLYPVRGAEEFNKGRSKDPESIGVSAPDDRTVRIELASPTPYLPTLVAQPPWFPVNPRVIARFGPMDRRGTAWTRPGNLVGNGPFTLEEWKPNARITVVRSEAYWNAAAVGLRRIRFFPIENPDAEERAFRAGELHITYSIPVARLDAYRRDDPRVLRVDPFLLTSFLRFNTRRAPFSDARVRLALSLAIDREAIANRVLSGAYPPAHAITPPGCGGYTARASVGFDPARARELLALAGFPGGKGLGSFEVQLRNDGVQQPMMEAIQAMWKKELGVDASLAVLEQKTWVQNQQDLGYGVSTSVWGADFIDPVTFLDLFVTGGGNNWTGWGDREYDALIAAARGEASDAARMEDFQKAEAILLERGPVAPIYHGAHAYLIRPEVRGWKPALLGYHRYAIVSLGAGAPKASQNP